MTTRSRRTVVFLGPSLSANEARALLRADYHPPAGQGDVYRLLSSGVDTIVLIDGVFHGTPSVWQRELLDALEDGITVLGGASMGAIRAAELESFGMRGSGTVFRWYRDGVIDGDDEVALRHSDIDHDFRALSEPLVNIRATLAAAVREGCLEAAAASVLVEEAKAVYYPDRSFRRLLAGPLARGWPSAVRSRLSSFLERRAVDLKRADAIETLGCAAATNERGDSRRRGNCASSSASSLWAESRPLAARFGVRAAVSGAEVLRRARMDEELTAALRRDAIVRRFVSELARLQGVCVPEDEVSPACGLGTPPDEGWLAANGLTPAAHRRLLEGRARHRWFMSHLDAASNSGAETAPGGIEPRAPGRERALLLAWARTAGVSHGWHPTRAHGPNGAVGLGRGAAEDGEPGAEEALLRRLLEAGPGYFGLFWNEDLALLEELQITGAAARLANTGITRAPMSQAERLERGD